MNMLILKNPVNPVRFFLVLGRSPQVEIPSLMRYNSFLYCRTFINNSHTVILSEVS